MKYTGLIIFFGLLLSIVLRVEIFNTEIQGIHAWRQTQTMWNVRNFVRHDHHILNPRIAKFNGGKDNILRLEFPIMQYSIASVQRILSSESVVITRSILFLFSMLSVWGFYYLAILILGDRLSASFSSIFLLFSPLFYYYSINPIPDIFGLMCSIWFLYFVSKFAISNNIWPGIYSGIFITLAALSKLPFIVLGFSSVFLFFRSIYNEKQLTKSNLYFCIINILSLILISSWYLWVIPTWEGDFVTKGVFTNFLAKKEYLNILNFHLKFFLPHTILYWPVWIFFFIGLIKYGTLHKKAPWISFSLIGVFIYYFYEFNVIQYVHDYYLLPFLVLFYLIIGVGVNFMTSFKYKIIKLIPLIFLFSSPIHAYIKGNPKWTNEYDHFNPDVYHNRKILQEIVPADERCIIMNDESECIFSYNIDKMGHMFSRDDLPIEWIGDMIKNHNVTHMYSDSRFVDQDTSFQKYVDTLLLKAGSVHVYKFKSAKDIL